MEDLTEDAAFSQSEDEQRQNGKSLQVSTKRQARINIFNKYVSNRVQKMTTDELYRAPRSVDEEHQSIRQLLANEESRKITQAREYQLELFERAKQQNTIAVLDTGSGKTHISVLLLRHILDEELEQRSQGRSPKLAFFLVDSIALVMQQHAVLSENLAHKVEPLCGAMNIDLWDKTTWDEHFGKNMAFVCTAAVLHQCLFHLFLQIEQINLLVFDEAHHAKKNHPYAMIVKDYYLKQRDPQLRPKIFGMTASPVDIKTTDVRQAAARLEDMLQAQIATTSSLALPQSFVNRPKEDVAQYCLVHDAPETNLHRELEDHYGRSGMLRPVFEKSKAAARELGDWCADKLWERALNETALKRMERRLERLLNNRKDDRSVTEHDGQLMKLRGAADIVRDHQYAIPQKRQPLLSGKVLTLCQYLDRYFAEPSDARCIVFVERRDTACLLLELFNRLEDRPAHLKSGVLIGGGSIEDARIAFRQQVMNLQKFRRGDINCLFATSIAEEGLDIPACNLVIRFDLYKTMIQYIQSRGRARHSNSTYLHMLEVSNLDQQYIMREVVKAEQLMRSFCEALPEDRKLNGNDDEVTPCEYPFDSTDSSDPRDSLPTGASLAVLAHFVSALPNESEESLSPIYNVIPERRQYICEVILPETSPIRSMVGSLCRSKGLAKRSAALQMCNSLKHSGHLDENWIPTYRKKLPAFRNALLAVDSSKNNRYRMKTKPDLWKAGQGKATDHLYLTVLDVSEGLDRPHEPIGLLTRNSLPGIPMFPLFLVSGKETGVDVKPVKVPLPLKGATLEGLTKYTLRAWKDIWNKTFEDDSGKLSWWLAPIKRSAVNQEFAAPYHTAEELIDWCAINAVLADNEYPWSDSMTEDWLKDRFIVDRWSGGRRFFVQALVPDLKPNDPVPRDAAQVDTSPGTILDYTVSSLFRKSRKDKEWDMSQPVLHVEQISLRQNLLSPPSDKEKSLRTKAYICPSPMKISVLSSLHVAMLLVFPPIIYRIEQYLIALEAFDMLGVEVSAALALEAMTKNSYSDVDGEEQTRVQRNMGDNYERLEFLGDCVLKMATTLSLYARNIAVSVGTFHDERMRLLCNLNLFETGMKMEIYQYVRSQAFSRRTWYPEGLKLLEGKGHKKTSEDAAIHALSDKTIADVCEAAIGAAFLQHDQREFWRPEHWDAAVKAVTVLVNSEEHRMLRWSDYNAVYQLPDVYNSLNPAAWLDMARQIEEAHDYHFKHPGLLRSAFTHSSMGSLSEGIPNYERLEFLGDSLLEIVCVSYLFDKYPTKDEQWLTEHKGAMVTNRFLGALCVKLGLHRFLRYNGSSAMEQAITRYVLEVRELEAEADGRPDYWMDSKDAPKYLADIVEAYIGAFFVDSEFNFGEVHRFFCQHIQPHFEDMTIYDTFAENHPMRRLKCRLEIELGCRDFRLMGKSIDPLPGMQVKHIAGLMIHRHVVVDDVGKSGRYAKVRACAKALKLLEGLSQSEFKGRFGCSCAPGLSEDCGDRDIGSAI